MSSITRLRKSVDNNEVRFNTEASNPFLIPISFVLCSALNAANPNKPRQEISIAISVN